MTPLISAFHARRRRWLALLGLTPLLQACSPLRLINATVSASTHTVRADQPYGSDPRQQADVYLPARPVAGAPMAVFFYGGSWSSGERADYRFVGEALASRGIVTVVADYRLSPQVRYPVFLQDSALAVRWALDHATSLGASPERLFVVGHSAGAYNAAMLALDPRWLTAVNMTPRQLAGWVGLAGPYDFLPIGNPDVQVAFEWPNTPFDSQPLFQARVHAKAAPRTLLLGANSDSLVNPQRNTLTLAQTLSALGTQVDVELFDRVSHITLIGAMARPLRGLAPVLDRVSGFLNAPPA
ncbi:alpha/beta hydrolase [Hydrogenophaga sp.]|uniref:alpha/beta hydrolase n=1 Tax=Hydrogenophaga sp. TaxID=1904254 RepID=UPI0027203108|nr:alpha/beta hydrolase [Hydrogenophaga sp.]MDO9436065.1 alpha/beta hydrolase [Hydrogenophaga sp.]